MNRIATASGSPHDSTDASPAPRRVRLEWLDFFRGAAVLVMMETHVVNTFLAAGMREGGWFALLNYINGLVAPSFLFIAGFVLGMERRKSPGKPIPYARRAWRLLGIGALGYSLHFPIGPLGRGEWLDALRIGSQVDVLQCLALGLGLLLGVSWLVERLGQRPAVSWAAGVVALATATVLAAPLVQSWTGGPLALRAWVNGTTGSLFPMFPWVGFVFLGALAGACGEFSLPRRAGAVIGLAVLAWACRGSVFSAVSPSFFLERAVCVLALAAFCEWGMRQSLPPMVLYAGKHSLKFYVVHLAMISAVAGAGVLAPSLDWSSITMAVLSVGAASFGVVWALGRVPQVLAAVRRVRAEPVAAESVEIEDLPSPVA